MSEFEVTVTETLKKTVTVEAESKLEAQQLVNDNPFLLNKTINER